MRDTLEDLYFGKITPNEQDITPGSVLANAMDQAEQCEEKLADQNELQRDSAHLGDEIAARKSTLAGFTAERETTERALGDLETLAQQMRGDEDGRRALIEDYRAKIKAAEEEIAQHDAVTASLRADAWRSWRRPS